MFGDNWFLFLLIVMIVFISDGDLSQREICVMLAIFAALALTDSSSTTTTSSTDTNCFCDKTI